MTGRTLTPCPSVPAHSCLHTSASGTWLPGRTPRPALLSTRLALFPWAPSPHCRHSSCGPFRPVTKDTRQQAFSQGGWKSLTFVSCTPTWSLLNRCLAGRAQMWRCSHGDLGRSLSRIIFQKGVCAVLFPIILLACTFQVLDNLWYSKSPIRTGYEKVFNLRHCTGIWTVEGNSKWESHWPGRWRFPFECNLPSNVINGNQISLVLKLPMESSDKCGNCN